MMIDALRSAATLSDGELVAKVRALAQSECQATAQLIAVLVEMDARRLYLAQGRSSLFSYCTQVLHMSEHAAYRRIEAARAARKFLAILDRLADGSLHLTAVSLLAAHNAPSLAQPAGAPTRWPELGDLRSLAARMECRSIGNSHGRLLFTIR